MSALEVLPGGGEGGSAPWTGQARLARPRRRDRGERGLLRRRRRRLHRPRAADRDDLPLPAVGRRAAPRAAARAHRRRRGHGRPCRPARRRLTDAERRPCTRLGPVDLDVVFLGTAGSTPTARRAPAATLIRRGGDRILLDCGEGTQRQLLRSQIGLVDLDVVLFSHYHADHVLGLPGAAQDLRPARARAGPRAVRAVRARRSAHRVRADHRPARLPAARARARRAATRCPATATG